MLKTVPVILFLAFVLVGLYVLTRPVGEKLRSWILRGLLFLIVLSFLWIKQYSIFAKIPALHLTEPNLFATVGLSYILFRIVHVLVDSGTDENVRLTPQALVAYILNPFTFVSGPIQRAQSFLEYWQSGLVPLPLALSAAATTRVIAGYFKVVVVGAVLHSAFTAVNTDGVLGIRGFATVTVLYTGFLYFNFSGYMDIMIGIGHFFGLRIPENFDRPFLAENFLDFWSRWHMTLSVWFRTYVFSPIVTQLARMGTRPQFVPFYAVIGFFITFLLMGLWHGTTLAYVYYGLFLALGVSSNKLYEIKMRDWLGKQRFKALRGRQGYAFVCRCLTGAYFSYALACVWMPSDQLVEYVSNTPWKTHIASFFVVVIFYGGLYALVAAIHRFANSLRPKGQTDCCVADFYSDLWTGVQLVLVFVFLARRESAPGFVYKVF